LPPLPPKEADDDDDDDDDERDAKRDDAGKPAGQMAPPIGGGLALPATITTALMHRRKQAWQASI
jgi:hypothetical protein